MKSLLLGFVCLLLATASRADTFDLGEHGKLTVTVPKDWSAEGHDWKGMAYAIQLKPKDSDKTAVRLTVVYSQRDNVKDAKKVEDDFQKLCSPIAAASVEKKVDSKPLHPKSGYGFYASFTDESLVGKPATPDAFKTITPGILVLPPETVVSITILTEDATGAPFQQALEIVQSTTLKSSEK